MVNKYSLTDQGYGLRDNNVSLVLNWNAVPSTGLLTLHHGAESCSRLTERPTKPLHLNLRGCYRAPTITTKAQGRLTSAARRFMAPSPQADSEAVLHRTPSLLIPIARSSQATNQYTRSTCPTPTAEHAAWPRAARAELGCWWRLRDGGDALRR